MSQQTREALAAAITAHFQDEEPGGVVTAMGLTGQWLHDLTTGGPTLETT